MKILLLTPDIPYPSESGAAIRNWGIISGLSAVGHEVTLLTFADHALDARSTPLVERCSAVHRVPLPDRGRTARLIQLATSGSADMETRLSSSDFAKTLRHLLQVESFDIAQFSGLELGGYLDAILSEKGGAKVVYDALNAEADLQRLIADVDSGSFRRVPAMLYSRAQARRLARFEARVCRLVDAVVAVSGEDRALLQRYAGAPITIVSNGIHADDYCPRSENQRARKQLVFTGKMDYRPNVDAIEWFCADILPKVRKQIDEIQFKVVGRNPHPRLQALAETGAFQLTGWVESVLPHLHEAALYVVPLRMGSGTRLKVLQAMAAGCAVISTSIGAAGLNDDSRATIAIADDASAFAEAIVSLLEDDNQRKRMGELAQQRVRAHYDWRALIPLLLDLYAGLRDG